jgi:sugar/nucleoside kinase (ribokinase family)
MNNVDLLTIGDSSIDIFMKIDRNFVATETDLGERSEICFIHGTKVPVEKFETSIAGNACNVSVGCTQLGMSVAIYTELGDDSNGERVIKELQKRDVDTSYCIKNKIGPTNVHAVIVSGKGGERTIFSYHEPRDYKILNWPKPNWIFYSSLAKGFEKFQTELVEYIKGNPGIGVAFNPGTQQLRSGVEVLKNFLEVTDILFVNKEEAQWLTDPKEMDMLVLHKKLRDLGPKLTVITLGTEGSTAFDGKNIVTKEIYDKDCKIMDKTGAGDAYSAAFIAALHYGKSLETAMEWGTINSSHAIREIGAIKGLLNKKQIEAATK